MSSKTKSWVLLKKILQRLNKTTLRTIDLENNPLKFNDAIIYATNLQNVLQNKLNVINKWEFNPLIKKFLISKINKFSSLTPKIMKSWQIVLKVSLEVCFAKTKMSVPMVRLKNTISWKMLSKWMKIWNYFKHHKSKK